MKLSIFDSNFRLRPIDEIRLIQQLRVLNSERANAKGDEEHIRLTDKIIVLKRKMRKLGLGV
jgi:hypothetical protein